MTHYVYGSTDEQKLEENAKLHWTDRQINKLLKEMKRGDRLMVNNPNNIACSTAQILEVLSIAAAKGLTVHFARYDMTVKNESSDINTQYLINLISKIESDFVSQRTTHALARRKAAGLPLGRPKGRQNKSLKLDKYETEITKYLGLGVSKASIAKIVACHPQTLYDWLERKETRNAQGV